MFEDLSYDVILQRMLDRVSSSMDKREGSLIYDALAPAAMELMLMYIELNAVLDETFGDTASRTYLLKRAAERGLSPTEATYAVLQGEFNMDIPVGSRFSCYDLNYVATEQMSTGIYKMTCETLGVDGNKNFGTLIPIDYIEGLETASLTELLIPGEDEEDTEVFRARYFASFDSQAFGGNQADYIEKTNAIAGVGCVKVYPVWDGGGTVKLVILDSEYSVPSEELVETVQETVDPASSGGTGTGFAPIGHVVTVMGAEAVAIDVESTFTFEDGWDFDSTLSNIEEAIEDYFIELRQTWADEDAIIVRVSQIETRILALAGVMDIEGTTINESTTNVTLGADEVPVLGVVSDGE